MRFPRIASIGADAGRADYWFQPPRGPPATPPLCLAHRAEALPRGCLMTASVVLARPPDSCFPSPRLGLEENDVSGGYG